MNYRELHIRAWQEGPNRAWVMVHRSPVGDMRAPVAVAVPPTIRQDLDAVFRDAPQKLWFANRGQSLGQVAEIGRVLAAILLPPPVLSRVVGSLGAIGEGERLRIRLCLDAMLVDLPWEFLYRPDFEGGPQLGGFLVLDNRVSLVREAPRFESPIPESTEPDRLLFVGTYWSSSTGPIDTWQVYSEYRHISQSLRPVNDYLIPTFLAAHDDVAAALSVPASILHYSGHTFRHDETAYLERLHPGDDLVAESVDRMPAGELSRLMRQAQTRLAVFSACNSGQWWFVEPFLRNELRALVGVHGLVSNVGASAFSVALYGALAAGLSLDEAVAAGRSVLLTQAPVPGLFSYEWAAFMVYASSAQSVLLPRSHDSVRDERAALLRADCLTTRPELPRPEALEFVERLCALLPSEFDHVVADLGLSPPELVAPDRRSRAQIVFRHAEDTGNLERLRDAIEQARRVPPPPTRLSAAPDARLNISGADFGEISAAIISGYDRDELEDVLRRRMDVQLDVITSPSKFSKVVFDLLGWAERMGRWIELVRVTAQERPDNSAMKTVYEKFVLPKMVTLRADGHPVTAPDATTSAGLAIRIRPGLPSLNMAEWTRQMIRLEGQVCQILLGDRPAGTGFLVGPEAVLTNHHVLQPVMATNQSSTVTCQFDDKVMPGTSVLPGLRVKLHPQQWLLDSSPPSAAEIHGTPDEKLPTTNELDYALVRLERPVGGERPDERTGATALVRGWVRIPDTDPQFFQGMPVLILQHPQGRPIVLEIDTDGILGLNSNSTRVRYTTNTDAGSSGAPCFSLDWELVALHHFGDPTARPKKYNQGVPIHLIRDRVRRNGFGDYLGGESG